MTYMNSHQSTVSKTGDVRHAHTVWLGQQPSAATSVHIESNQEMYKCGSTEGIAASGSPPVVLCVPSCLYTALEMKVLR